MRIVLFDDYRPGILAGDKVIDITGLLTEVDLSDPRRFVPALIGRFDALRPAIDKLVAEGKGLPLSTVRLRAPSPDPVQLLCAAKNYKDGHETPQADFFLKPRDSIVGQGDAVVLPPHQARVFHCEPELAVIIGSKAEKVKAAGAMKHVFGYTCFMDVSARGLRPTFYIHKSFATFGPMGPAIVTADEVRNPHDLRVRFFVDGELRQDFSTAGMANSIETLIETASAVCPLYPGDVLSTGTHHAGLGPIEDGQTLELDIEGVGKLTATVRDPLKRHWDREAAKAGKVPA